MVNTAVADVVGPAVAAEDPHGLLVEVILLGQDLAGELAGLAGAGGAAGSLLGLGRSQSRRLIVAVDLLAHIGAEEGDAVIDTGDALFHCLDEGSGGSLVLVAVVIGLEPCIGSILEFLAAAGSRDHGLNLGLQVVTDLLLAEVHAEAVLCVILEQGVGPCRSLARLVDGVRGQPVALEMSI